MKEYIIEGGEDLNEFSRLVQDHFHFLVDDYGFTNEEMKKLNFGDDRDKHVRIDYSNDFLCVRIVWYLLDASIGVGLIELTGGSLPSRFSYFKKEGFQRAVKLSTLIEYVTNGELKDPLPKFGPSAGARKINKARRQREKLIEQDKRTILATYADWLRTYGHKVLSGDTSILGPVWNYEAEKIAQDYYR